ncbi:MAG: flagellar hook-basal body protein [Bacillota bacterium]
MRGLYLAEGAMLVQQARLSLIGNNLANLNTVGYKRDDVAQTSFGEWMLYQRGGGATPGVSRTLPAALGSAAHNVAVQETVTNFAPGPLQYTGRNLDLALSGDCYFQVQKEDGFLYTRNGRFFIDDAGFLVTAEGYPVWGVDGPLLLGTEQVEIDPDGTVYTGDIVQGRLRLVYFTPEAEPLKAGDNYFRVREAAVSADGGEGRVWASFVEGSNTDLVREMTSMIQVRRSYEAAQKVMITYDSLLQKAANDLGSLY